MLAFAPGAFAQKFYTYVGDLGPTNVLLAWGTTAGENTIGRSSKSHGPAEVRIDGRNLQVVDKNWIDVTGLKPDTEYPYEVLVNRKAVGKGRARTWAEKVYPKLTYFNEVDRGGHFAAWEEPALFATELRAAFRSLR